jgi:hypothetical protein
VFSCAMLHSCFCWYFSVLRCCLASLPAFCRSKDSAPQQLCNFPVEATTVGCIDMSACRAVLLSSSFYRRLEPPYISKHQCKGLSIRMKVYGIVSAECPLPAGLDRGVCCRAAMRDRHLIEGWQRSALEVTATPQSEDHMKQPPHVIHYVPAAAVPESQMHTQLRI